MAVKDTNAQGCEGTEDFRLRFGIPLDWCQWLNDANGLCITKSTKTGGAHIKCKPQILDEFHASQGMAATMVSFSWSRSWLAGCQTRTAGGQIWPFGARKIKAASNVGIPSSPVPCNKPAKADEELGPSTTCNPRRGRKGEKRRRKTP